MNVVVVVVVVVFISLMSVCNLHVVNYIEPQSKCGDFR